MQRPFQRNLNQSLFSFSSMTSLVLCLATCMLWARSCVRHDSFVVTDDSRYWFALIAERGAVAFGWRFTDGYYHTDYLPPTFPTEPLPHYKLASHWHAQHFARRYAIAFGESGLHDDLARSWRFLGFGRSWHAGKEYLLLPLWMIVFVTLILPIRRLWLIRRIAGHCPACGYDLRATPEQCPECGNPSPKLTVEQ